MSEEIIDIVDIEDNIIDRLPLKTAFEKNLAHRIAHVFIYDVDGNLLLQKRSMNKSFMPGTWATSACGHIRSGETPEEGAKRELMEELGIDAELKFTGKHLYHHEDMPLFLYCYSAVHEGPFKPSEDEVEGLKFFSRKELEEIPEDSLHSEFAFLKSMKD